MNLRRVMITWNNWNALTSDDKNFDNEFDAIEYLEDLPHVKYVSVGFEVGGEESTSHLQAVVAFSQQKTFDTLRKYFQENHIEKIFNFEKSVEYTQKDGNYFEFGEKPYVNQGKRTDMQRMVESIQEGATDDELLENFPSQYFMYKGKIDKLRQDILYKKFGSELRKDLYTAYVSGESGIGKTYAIYDIFGFSNVYVVTNYGPGMFDGYKGQDVLVLDEFEMSAIPINELLTLLDIYPMKLKARYEDKVACFTKVIIISNVDYYDQFKWIPHERQKALKRRFKQIFTLVTDDDIEEYRIALKYLESGETATSLAYKYFDEKKVVVNA